MTTGFRTFDVTFLTRGTEDNLIVTASDVEQAFKAARVKLAIGYPADTEITGIRRQGPVHATAFEQSIDPSDPAAVLLQVATVIQGDVSLTLDGDTPESTAFFLSALCLVDNGHALPDTLATELERLLEETSICWRWGIDPFDGLRPALDSVACISDIAGELTGSWRPTPTVLSDHDFFELQYGYRAPVDFDEGVEFAGNSLAYCYILLAAAHKVLAEKPDEYLIVPAERILPRFMMSNPSASEEISDVLLSDPLLPAWDGVPLKI
ncbi:hypothetical protein GR198_05655 [Rhizobium leguminosarum]|uniref:hypothetical protein n=1 Tax=Rhizobium leguminosarum TaxID=384 RepID=UPI0013C14644|nr:hypothetical protein [Rhizobium leguminosarum]NEH55231.1 hypothetical protein [Rhizobium leguminosarum]